MGHVYENVYRLIKRITEYGGLKNGETGIPRASGGDPKDATQPPIAIMYSPRKRG